jgi:hypothetical protein
MGANIHGKAPGIVRVPGNVLETIVGGIVPEHGGHRERFCAGGVILRGIAGIRKAAHAVELSDFGAG